MKSLKRGKNTSKPEIANISEHGLWIFLGRREYFLAFEQFPWFREAKVSEITNFEVYHGDHFYWPELDVDLSTNIIAHPEKYRLIAK